MQLNKVRWPDILKLKLKGRIKSSIFRQSIVKKAMLFCTYSYREAAYVYLAFLSDVRNDFPHQAKSSCYLGPDGKNQCVLVTLIVGKNASP